MLAAPRRWVTVTLFPFTVCIRNKSPPEAGAFKIERAHCPGNSGPGGSRLTAAASSPSAPPRTGRCTQGGRGGPAFWLFSPRPPLVGHRWAAARPPDGPRRPHRVRARPDGPGSPHPQPQGAGAAPREKLLFRAPDPAPQVLGWPLGCGGGPGRAPHPAPGSWKVLPRGGLARQVGKMDPTPQEGRAGPHLQGAARGRSCPPTPHPPRDASSNLGLSAS